METTIYKCPYNGIWTFDALNAKVKEKLPNHTLVQVIYSQYKNGKNVLDVLYIVTNRINIRQQATSSYLIKQIKNVSVVAKKTKTIKY